MRAPLAPLVGPLLRGVVVRGSMRVACACVRGGVAPIPTIFLNVLTVENLFSATVQHLLDLDADVNALDTYGESPLFYAVRGGAAVGGNCTQRFGTVFTVVSADESQTGDLDEQLSLATNVLMSDKDADARCLKCIKVSQERARFCCSLAGGSFC